MDKNNNQNNKKINVPQCLKRHPNESEPLYIWRVGKLIDSGKFKNFSEITDIINKELNCDSAKFKGESAYRKRYQNYRDFNENILPYIKVKSDLENQVYELQQERYKLQATKSEINKYLRQKSRKELFYENVGKEFKDYAPPTFDYTEMGNLNKDYILTLADIHMGSCFSIFNNSYSTKEVERRFSVLFDKTVQYIRENNITHLNVLNLGDDIQGMLRISDVKLNELPIVKSTVIVTRLIANFLNELSKYVFIDYYHCPTSNHNQLRPLGTKASELADEDITYVIVSHIVDILKDNKRVAIHFKEDEDYINFKILDEDVIAMHGHQFKNVPSALKDISYLHQKFYKTLFLAHFHASEEITVGSNETLDCEVLVAPSMIGSCPYSNKIMKSAKASCKIYEFTTKEGHTGTKKFILN